MIYLRTIKRIFKCRISNKRNKIKLRTRFVYNFGERSNVKEYIEEVVKLLQNPNFIHETAVSMHNYLLKNDSFHGLAPSMLAMTLVNLSAKENGYSIPSSSWYGLCSYNTLLKHSKMFKSILEKSREFPNLKYRKIGR